jgi:hypothetical protein
MEAKGLEPKPLKAAPPTSDVRCPSGSSGHARPRARALTLATLPKKMTFYIFAIDIKLKPLSPLRCAVLQRETSHARPRARALTTCPGLLLMSNLLFKPLQLTLY